MSEQLFFEIPVVGTKYKFGDWKTYAVHDEHTIKGFFGDYRWLSNFFYSPVCFDGREYPSSENAYQAAKLIHADRCAFTYCSPIDAKKRWKEFERLDETSEQWDARRYDVMSVIVFDKFYRSKGLRQKLLDTGERLLEETNHWKDDYWGVDLKIGGKNNLGKILMKVRNYWRNV